MPRWSCWVLFLLFAFHRLSATGSFSPGSWESLGPTAATLNTPGYTPLSGGCIQYVAVAATDPNTMYAAGGVGQEMITGGGLYKTTDGGVHWTPTVNGLTDRFVTSVWLDPTNPSTLVVTGFFGEIFRSTDAGTTWKQVYASSTSIYPVMWACGLVQNGALLYAGTAAGLVRSTDAGATWSLLYSTTTPVLALGSGGGALYIGCFDGSVLTLANGSTTWRTVTPANAGRAAPLAIAVSPSDGNIAIVLESVANTGSPLVMTRNGGASWSELNPGGLDEARYVALDAQNTIYYGADAFVSVSKDGGATWSSGDLFLDVRSLRLPTMPGGALIACGDQGIFRTTDLNTWTSLNGDLSVNLLFGVSVAANSILTASQDYPSFESSDSGHTWTATVPFEGSNVLINPGNSSYRYSLSVPGGGLFVSADGGVTWEVKLPRENLNWTFQSNLIAVDPANPSHVYVAGGTGVWRSTDWGLHWSPTNWPMKAPSAILVAPNGTIFVGDDSGQPLATHLYTSQDGGSSWTGASATFSGVATLDIDPTNPNIVLVGAYGDLSDGGGVFMSTDGGKTFVPDNGGLSPLPGRWPAGYYVRSIRFSPQSNPSVAAVATNNGLYLQHPGSPWTEISGNAIARVFTQCAWDSGYLYTSTFGQGVLRSPVAPLFGISATAPQDQTVGGGQSVSFSVTATSSAGPVRYQWFKDGVAIAGATNASLTIAIAQPADEGTYQPVVANSLGSVASSGATLRVSASRLTNLSVRGIAGSGDQTLIAGFAIRGSGTKPILIRGIGPTLAQFSINDPVADPVLSVFDQTTVIAQNAGWGGGAILSDTFRSVGAFALPNNSKDAALVLPLTPKTYSVQIRAASGTGVALVELYDVDSGGTTAQLSNVSARNQVGTGGDILILGFVISGAAPKTLLVRGVGPSLAQFGVGGALSDPQLTVLDANRTIVGQNDNWGGGTVLANAFTQVGAFPLPATSKDAAFIATFAPGAYTVQVSGVNQSTGVALVEVYELP